MTLLKPVVAERAQKLQLQNQQGVLWIFAEGRGRMSERESGEEMT